MFTTRSRFPKALVIRSAARDTALILCAHGTNGTPGIAEAHARAIRDRAIFADVVSCCIKGAPTLSETLRRRGPGPKIIVPTLMATGVIARQIETIDPPCGGGPSALHVCPPIGEEPVMTGILAARARALCDEIGAPTSQTTLLIVGHGTPRDPASARAVNTHAARLRNEKIFHVVHCAFLDQPPTIADSVATAPPGPLVAIGFFADHGAHGDTDMKRLLSDGERPVHYAGPIGNDLGIVDLIVELACASCS